MICDSASVLDFLNALDKKNLSLKMVLDYPQLISGERISMDNINLEKIFAFNERLKQYTHLIGGFHMWGKRKGEKTWASHTGDLNDYFSGDKITKQAFLSSIHKTFNDETARFFVPEVNSAETDLHSIIADLIASGFIFVNN